MSKQVIIAPNAPAAIGPYSTATQFGNTVYVSGQLPTDPLTGAIPDGICAQTKQSLHNIKAVLEAAGLSMNDVMKTTVFLSDINNFSAMNEIYATFFEAPYPARAAFQVAALPKGALVEIEVIAAK